MWLASPDDCGEARCPIPFDSPLFVEGTFTTETDICFPTPVIDTSGLVKRRGLCALPVAMVPRTPLPPIDSCPKLEPGDPEWPFPNYSWNVEGQSGQISTQVFYFYKTASYSSECR